MLIHSYPTHFYLTTVMMNSFLVFVVLLFIKHIVLASDGIAEQIHKGIDNTVGGVIKGAIEVTGTPAQEKDIVFLLKTSKDKDLLGNAKSFELSKITATEDKIFFLVHGWTQNRTTCPWFAPLTETLLEKYPKSHVVQVDWGKLAEQNYAYAAFSTQSIGTQILLQANWDDGTDVVTKRQHPNKKTSSIKPTSEIIGKKAHQLIHQYKFPQKRIVFIGHSLGAQILGWIGKEYQKHNQHSLSWIVALDPAGPIFSVRPESRRLNQKDGQVVMVIHTDRLKFGFPVRCGTIDFFPNDGLNQPGCVNLNLTDLSLSSLSDAIWCGHRRAHDLFIEAIKYPEGFIATKCDNYKDYENRKCDGNVEVSMGDWQTSETGSFYLETTGETPFIKRQKSNKNSKTGSNSSQ